MSASRQHPPPTLRERRWREVKRTEHGVIYAVELEHGASPTVQDLVHTGRATPAQGALLLEIRRRLARRARPAPLPVAIARRRPGGWHHDGHGWRHRPWWKVAINTVLRAFQPHVRKLVVYTRCEGGDDADPQNPPRTTGYGVGLVLHRPPEAP